MRSYSGRALDAPWWLRSVSMICAALIVAAVLAFGLFVATLLPYFSNLPR